MIEMLRGLGCACRVVGPDPFIDGWLIECVRPDGAGVRSTVRWEPGWSGGRAPTIDDVIAHEAAMSGRACALYLAADRANANGGNNG